MTGTLRGSRADGRAVDDRDGIDAAAPTLAANDPREGRVSAAELVAGADRLRRALRFGFVAWLGFLPVDIAMARLVYPGAGWTVIGLRLALGVAIAGVAWRLQRPVAAATLRRLDVGIYAGAALALATMCVAYGGLESPYIAGLMAVQMSRGAFIADSWRMSLVPMAVITLAFPVTIGVAAAWSDPVRAQLGDPAALTVGAVALGNLVASMALSLLGGHMIWALRREVFVAKQLGRYRLKERIGAGGMGQVFRAHHAALRRDVAVKVMHPGRDANEVALRRFEREAEALSELKHPNTVRIYDYGRADDGTWFYVMELLEGRTLAKVVKDEGPLEPRRATRIVLQAARALAEAHARGIVHRDVKPQNLFVTQAGDGGEPDFMKLLDFGIALVTDPERTAITAESFVGGTPDYLSPEVARGLPADPRTDVYALGAVLFFTLVGRPPFQAPTPVLVMTAHVHQAPPVPSAERPGVPARLDAIVARCLAKSPDERYANAAELAAALAEV